MNNTDGMKSEYRVVCKGCGWKGEVSPMASDKCPRCSKKVQLAPKESQAIMRDAIQKACGKPVAGPPLQPMSRTMVDKDAPKDEGEWEFRLKEGVLTIIAWNDEKNEAQFVRLVRRGTEMHVQCTREESEE